MNLESAPETLDLAVAKVFINHPHLNKRKVHFTTDTTGRVTLSGQVNSFFEKQLAQEALRPVHGIQQIENYLSVQE